MAQTAFVLYWQFAPLITFVLVILLIRNTQALESIVPVLDTGRSTSTTCAFASLPSMVLAIAFGHCVFYLVAPNFADYAEPLIPILAVNFLNGAAVYGDWRIGDQLIGCIYGPYLFLIQAAAMAVSPTMLASKLVGVIFAIAALGVFAASIARRRHSPGDVLTLCALMIALLAFNLHYWFWNRPDPILIAIAALSVLLYERCSPSTSLVGHALLAGVAMNLKIFAPIYLVPLALASASALPGSARFRAAVRGAAILAIAVVLPFILGPMNLLSYINNILLLPNQGVDPVVIAQTAVYGAIILLPPIIAVSKCAAPNQDRATVLMLVACAAVLALISGKPGGGIYYMMPFIPISLYLTVRLRDVCGFEQRTSDRRTYRAMLGVVCLCAAPIWGYSWYQIGKPVIAFGTERQKAAELRDLFRRYSRAEMGHGAGPRDSSDEYLRVEKAFLGQVTRFDFINYGDQRSSGVSAAIMYPLFEQCRVPTWILARNGGAFDGHYLGASLFDDHIRRLFSTNYALEFRGSYYDAWSCRDALPSAQ